VLRDFLAIHHADRQDQRSDHHKTFTHQGEIEIEQIAAEVHHDHAGETDQAADNFGNRKPIVVIEKMTQQHTEEHGGAVHDRAFYARGISQPHIEKHILHGGLGKAQQRQFTPIAFG